MNATKSNGGVLHEMLRSTKSGGSKSSWKVLIMDKLTVRIVSCACKMADINEEGVPYKFQKIYFDGGGHTQEKATFAHNGYYILYAALKREVQYVVNGLLLKGKIAPF